MSSIPMSFIPLPGVEEAVFAPKQDGLFKACSGEKWGFIDLRGRVVIPFAYQEASNGFFEDRAAVKTAAREGSWGYIDRAGHLIAPARYASTADFHDGRALVARAGRAGWCWGYLDLGCSEVVPPRYMDGTDFCDGIAGIRDEHWVNRFIGIDGRPAFDFASSINTGCTYAFANGFAAVCDEHRYKWGFLDRTGRPICDFGYDKAWAFSEEFGAVAHRVGTTNDDHEDSLYSVGYLDAAGREVIKPRFGGAYPFKEGRARVDLAHPRQCRRHRIGFIDAAGREVVPCVYDEAQDFSEGLAAVRRDGKWGFLDRSGALAIETRYDYAGPFSGGVAEVGIHSSDAGTYGFIDKSGAEVLPRQYSSVWTAVNGVALVEQGGRMGPGLESLPGAQFHLVLFGISAQPNRADVGQALDSALARARDAADEREAFSAWEALEGLLGKYVSAGERGKILRTLGEQARDPVILEQIACDLAQHREDAEAARLLQKALERAPDRSSVRLSLQAIYLRQGELARAEALNPQPGASKPPRHPADRPAGKPGRRPGRPMEGSEVQAKIDQMHRFVNEAYAAFAAGQGVASLVKRARQAAALEQELLAYWQGQSLSGRDIPAKRGELSASAGYIAGLRQAKRFGEAAAWFCKITADRHLLGLCLKDFPESAENTINNGLGALIDTRTKADLDYGGEILDFLDHAPGGFQTAMLPLACACLATCRKETGRALGYLRAAVRLGRGKKILSDAGSDICAMARQDPDLTPLRELPEFDEILSGRGRPKGNRGAGNRVARGKAGRGKTGRGKASR